MRTTAGKILLLGYSPSETNLFEKLAEAGYVTHHSTNSEFEFKDFDLIVSYGYKHKISKLFIEVCPVPIINLHISYFWEDFFYFS